MTSNRLDNHPASRKKPRQILQKGTRVPKHDNTIPGFITGENNPDLVNAEIHNGLTKATLTHHPALAPLWCGGSSMRTRIESLEFSEHGKTGFLLPSRSDSTIVPGPAFQSESGTRFPSDSTQTRSPSRSSPMRISRMRLTFSREFTRVSYHRGEHTSGHPSPHPQS